MKWLRCFCQWLHTKWLRNSKAQCEMKSVAVNGASLVHNVYKHETWTSSEEHMGLLFESEDENIRGKKTTLLSPCHPLKNNSTVNFTFIEWWLWTSFKIKFTSFCHTRWCNCKNAGVVKFDLASMCVRSCKCFCWEVMCWPKPSVFPGFDTNAVMRQEGWWC